MKLTPEFTSGLIVGIIASLLGAVVGALIVVAWDVWKERKQLGAEQQRGIRLLRGEVLANVAILDLNKDYLGKDIELAKENREIVVPVNLLSTRAWESVQLAGILSARHPGLLKELEQTYISASILNQRIQSRELYRVVSQAMSNYNERRALINRDLVTAVEKLLERFKGHLQALDGLIPSPEK